jgi:hypothetical protein
VLTAVKLMYAGAAVSAVTLIIALALIGVVGIRAVHGTADPSLIIPLAIVFTPGRDRRVAVDGPGERPGPNWARILSTVLFGLATRELTGVFRTPGIPCRFLRSRCRRDLPCADLAAVWLRWRPGSSAFFKPQASCDLSRCFSPLSRLSARRVAPDTRPNKTPASMFPRARAVAALGL